MQRVKRYINRFIVPKIESNGLLYLSDEYLFVGEQIKQRLLDLNFKNIDNFYSRLNVEKEKFLNEEYENIDNRIAETSILTEYQKFLDEKGYDNRHKKKVRGIIIDTVVSSEYALSRERYLYKKNSIELTFIDNISDFVAKINSDIESKMDLFYRGHSNLEWKLTPSIYRNNWIYNEQDMFRETLIRNPSEFYNTKSTFEKLTIMQHHGLPTRLLDITKNPLVALFFACSDQTQSNYPGEVCLLSPQPKEIKYFDSDTVSLLSNLAKAERDFSLLGIVNKEQLAKSTLGLKLLHLIKEEKPYFIPVMEPSDFSRTIIVKPINNNERIKRQQGFFILFGINENIYHPAHLEMDYHSKNIKKKLIIDLNSKANILRELQILGISHNSLFPEIDNGTSFIKEKYQ